MTKGYAMRVLLFVISLFFANVSNAQVELTFRLVPSTEGTEGFGRIAFATTPPDGAYFQSWRLGTASPNPYGASGFVFFDPFLGRIDGVGSGRIFSFSAVIQDGVISDFSVGGIVLEDFPGSNFIKEGNGRLDSMTYSWSGRLTTFFPPPVGPPFSETITKRGEGIVVPNWMASAVPEPETYALMLAGMICVGVRKSLRARART